MDIAKSETFNYFTILNKALLFLIKIRDSTNKIFSSLNVAISLSFLMDDATVYRTMFIGLFDYHLSDSVNAISALCWAGISWLVV